MKSELYKTSKHRAEAVKISGQNYLVLVSAILLHAFKKIAVIFPTISINLTHTY